MPLLIATNNLGKVREFRALLSDISIVSPTDLDLELEVEETGESFEENATIKARAFAAASNLIALADDSGLEVDALEGRPGVRSARYGGPGLDDTGRCRHLLEALQAFEEPTQRSARFRCTIVAVAPDGRTCRASGTCEGRIATRRSGAEGFGYDPVFFLPSHQKTMAQIAAETKNQISHRANALRAIRPLLLETFPELSNGPNDRSA